eukprot:3916044-Rhodomonas_salina.1
MSGTGTGGVRYWAMSGTDVWERMVLCDVRGRTARRSARLFNRKFSLLSGWRRRGGRRRSKSSKRSRGRRQQRRRKRRRDEQGAWQGGLK